MPVIRELVTRMLFQGDTAKVEAFDKQIDGLRDRAVKASEAFDGIAETVQSSVQTVSPAFEAIAEKIMAIGVDAREAASEANAAFFGIGESLNDLGELGEAAGERVREIFASLPSELRAIDEQAKIFGDSFDVARAKVQALEGAIKRLTLSGLTADSAQMQGLSAELAMARGEAGAGEAVGSGLGHHWAKGMAGMALGFVGFEAGMGLVEDFGKFQQNLQKAGANMLASKAEIAKMNEAAIGMAGQLQMTPEQLSEQLVEIGIQGVNPGDAIKMLPVTAMLSKALMANPTETAKLIATTAHTFYGANAGNMASHVGDVLSRTHELGGTTAGEMIDALKYVAPTAKAFHQSFEGVAANLATLGQAGVRGEQAGNALKSMMLSALGVKKLTNRTAGLIFPGLHIAKGETTTVWKQLGIQTEDDHHNLLPMSVLFSELRAKTAHMGTRDQGAIFNSIFGSSAVTSAMMLNQSKLAANNSEQIAKSAGNLQRVYKIMTDSGLIASWNQLRANVEALATTMIEQFAPSAEVVVRALATFTGWLMDAGKWIGKIPPLATVLKVAVDVMIGIGAIAAVQMLADALKTKLWPALKNAAKAVWKVVASLARAIWSMTVFAARAAWAGIQLVAKFVTSMITATASSMGLNASLLLTIGSFALVAAAAVFLWAAIDNGPVMQRFEKWLENITHGFWGLGKMIADNPLLSKAFGVNSAKGGWAHGAPGSPEYEAWFKKQPWAHPHAAPIHGGHTETHHHEGHSVTVHVDARGASDPHAVGAHTEHGVRRALGAAARGVPRQQR